MIEVEGRKIMTIEDIYDYQPQPLDFLNKRTINLFLVYANLVKFPYIYG